MHLESPNEPDNDEKLNCYLKVGNCGSCGCQTTLEPQSIPEIPETLIDHKQTWDSW